ncbi:MAG TPA: indole-3-glycerol phosphate synthase TrpC [Gemmataceae bacterium]|jgi:indole-3-glycerol phosphate synthase
MSNILDRIVAYKHQEIAAARTRIPDKELEDSILMGIAPPVRDFRAALENAKGCAIIAEVKRASPSAGLLREDFNHTDIARIYEQNGAACMSVLTDEPSFQGRLYYIDEIRNAVAPPLLRKDFILDRYQLLEARLAGADAVLLIAEILDDEALPRLLRQAEELRLQALVELYDRPHLPRVLDSGARLIGINNRDLRTFETRLEHTLDVLADLPSDVCLVSESGIRSRGDIERLEAAGVRAVLVGETLMRAPDIGAKLRELRGLAA